MLTASQPNVKAVYPPCPRPPREPSRRLRIRARRIHCTYVRHMTIETQHPTLPFELRDSAPAGVSVIFDNPRFTRDLHPETIPLVFITIRFAAEIDVKAVAAWLL